MGRGVWFQAAHAIGNVVIALAVGPELRRLLERYGRRLPPRSSGREGRGRPSGRARARRAGGRVEPVPAPRQQPDGGFAEPGGQSDPSLTAWACSASRPRDAPRRRRPQYLAGQAVPAGDRPRAANPRAPRPGRDTRALVQQLEGLRRPDGRIGTLVNSTIWGVLALRATGRPAGTSVRYLLRQQRRAAAGRGIRAASPTPTTRLPPSRHCGPRAFRRGRARSASAPLPPQLQRRDGGFPLVPGRGSDAQSTAWAIQAFVAARRAPGRAPFRYLAGLRRPDGSYRYSRSTRPRRSGSRPRSPWPSRGSRFR